MQVERPVINASPLIFLARVDGLEWVTKIAANPVAVPLAVRNEVAAGEGGAACGGATARDRDVPQRRVGQGCSARGWREVNKSAWPKISPMFDAIS